MGWVSKEENRDVDSFGLKHACYKQHTLAPNVKRTAIYLKRLGFRNPQSHEQCLLH